jgi:hypothetical protein
LCDRRHTHSNALFNVGDAGHLPELQAELAFIQVGELKRVVDQIMPMTSQEPIQQAERELAEVKGLVDEQYGLVMRQKQNGADIHEAVRLLIDLLELQQTHEQRLAQARIHHRQLSGRFAPRL